MQSKNTPVIIGIAEICDRPDGLNGDLTSARDPLTLMRDVTQLAAEDANHNLRPDGNSTTLLSTVDSIDIINPASWTYDDLPTQLCNTLDLSPARALLRPTGGETPMQALHAAADRIAKGESKCALIVGAEAQHSAASAMRAGVTLPWPSKAQGEPDYLAVAKYIEPRALQLGLFLPSHVYPFYDLACAHHWGQTPGQAIDESVRLWADYAHAAQANLYSWKTDDWTAESIKTPTPKNRLIAWPYTKAQVANPMVNQAAAIIVTNEANAHHLGVSQHQMIYITGGAFANAPRNFMARKNFYQCPAQDVVLNAASKNASVQFDAAELYSCFPIVPKMARRTLRLADDVPLTVTGGLSFFGAPLNNYMTHATCAMVRALRGPAKINQASALKTGLLYGQGEFLTKHYAVTLSNHSSGFIGVNAGNQQSKAEAVQGTIPSFNADATGNAILETFTVPYDRAGHAAHAVMVVRTSLGERSLAKFIFKGPKDLAIMTHAERSPIGRSGILTAGSDGVPLWVFKRGTAGANPS